MRVWGARLRRGRWKNDRSGHFSGIMSYADGAQEGESSPSCELPRPEEVSSGHLRTWDSVPGPRTNSGLAYADGLAGRFVWLKSKFLLLLTAGCRGDGILLTVRYLIYAVSNNKNERFQPY